MLANACAARAHIGKINLSKISKLGTWYQNTPIFGTVSGMLPKSKTVHRLGICSTSLKTYNSIKKDSFFYRVCFLRTALYKIAIFHFPPLALSTTTPDHFYVCPLNWKNCQN